VKRGSKRIAHSKPAAVPAERANRWLPARGAILIVIAIWTVYGWGLRAPLIFDDASSIVNNPSVVKLWPLWGDLQHPGPLNPPKEMSTSGRPLANFSLAVNYYFGQLDPLGYHIVNTIVHMLAALLLATIVYRTLNLKYFEKEFERPAAALALTAALLWALNPIDTESVQYITQRTECFISPRCTAACATGQQPRAQREGRG
jgi:hypothetical protein